MNEFDQSCSTNQPALESVTLPHVKTYNEQSMLAFVFDHDWTIVVLAIQWERNHNHYQEGISASVSSCTEKEIWWLPDAGIAPWNQTNKEYYKTASLRMMFLELVSLPPHNLYWLQTEPVLITNSLHNCHGQINFFYHFLRPRYCTYFCCCSSEYDWNVCFEFFFVEFMCFSDTKTIFFFWINAVEMSLLNLPFSAVIWRDCLSENRISSFQTLLAVSWVESRKHPSKSSFKSTNNISCET